MINENVLFSYQGPYMKLKQITKLILHDLLDKSLTDTHEFN